MREFKGTHRGFDIYFITDENSTGTCSYYEAVNERLKMTYRIYTTCTLEEVKQILDSTGAQNNNGD